MAENQDVNTLKRRGRRRLVGAIALVLAAVIVLPMLFDSEQRGSAPTISVRIPSEDDAGFTPKVTPKVAPNIAPKPSPVQEQRAAEKVAEQALAKAADKAPDTVPEQAAATIPDAPAAKVPEALTPKPAPKVEITVTKGSDKLAANAAAEKKRAESALAGEQFIVPAGAYADAAGVIEKLKAAKIPYYTEPIATKQGTVTRVRAGPFASRDVADKALQQLKGMGLKPGNIASKP